MKRLLAMLLSALFALFNNVGYVASGESEFNYDSYYTFEDQTALSPRQLYINNNAAGDVSDATPIPSPVACKVRLDQGSASSDLKVSDHYWIQGVEESEAPNNTMLAGITVFTFDGEYYIVCPQKAEIQNSANDFGGGHKMTLKTNDGYEFNIEGMERPYSCLNRKHQDNWTEVGDLSGKTIEAGGLIGVSKNGTKFTITKAGKKIDFLDYFYHK